MNSDFSEWYRMAGMEPNADCLPKRWAAIDEYSPKAGDVVSLAKLFYKIGKPEESFLAAFQSEFQKADPTFKMRNNEQELSVLAGAKLVDVINRSKDLADLGALSLVCGAAANLRVAPSVRVIPEIAASHLMKGTTERSAVDSKTAETDINRELLMALDAGEAPLPALAKQLRKSDRELAIVREESNMLWWLFSEFSRDEKRRWTDFSVPAAAMMAGKELADLTRVIPGPASARAFLDRVIRCVKAKPPASVLVTDAVNAVTIEWRQKYVDEKRCPTELEDLMPLSHGIKLSLSSPNNNEWFPSFISRTQIPATAKLVPNVLADQMFLESLLCRSWKQSNV